MREFLAYLQSVHPLSKTAEKELVEICSEISLEKNVELQSIGQSCKTVYFVVKGALRVYYYKDGNDITESFEFENAIVARVESLFSGESSSKGIQTLEKTDVIAIPAQKLFGLYDSFPEIERLFRKIFEDAHVKSIKRLESIQFHSAEERYHNLLNYQPALIKRISLKHIASFLGITPVSLSRIRANH
jgi:CRP-like cAMP-binding protein